MKGPLSNDEVEMANKHVKEKRLNVVNNQGNVE